MPETYETMYDPSSMILRPNVEDEKFKKEYALYYGFVTWTDELLGKLVKALKDTGQYDNTLIVFTSDHGWNMGSHNKRAKRSIYEEACRVPLIFSGGAVAEDRRGKREDVPVTTCDFFPTFAQLGGGVIPEGLHGDSLAGYVQCRSTVSGNRAQDSDRALAGSGIAPTPAGADLLDRESIYIEVLYTPKPKPAFDPPRRAVRTRRYKYVEEKGKPKFLFDLQTDPYEMNNRLEDPELKDVLVGLQEQFKLWHTRTGDCWPGRAWDVWKPEGWDRE